MRQNLQNAEQSEGIRIVRTDAGSAQNLHEDQNVLTAEEQRQIHSEWGENLVQVEIPLDRFSASPPARTATRFS